MDEIIIKVLSLELKGIKNVNYGKVKIKDLDNVSDGNFTFEHPILAIYGQNGSGKSSLIEALKILKSTLMGETLSDNIASLISLETNTFSLETIFFFKLNESIYLLKYYFEIKRNIDTVEFTKERLEFRSYINSRFTPYQTLFSIDNHRLVSQHFKKYFTYKEQIELETSSKILCSQASLFSKQFKEMIFDKFSNHILKDIVNYLSLYSKNKIIIIGNEFLSNISLNKIMPLNIYLDDEDSISFNNVFLNLLEPSVIEKSLFKYLEKSIKEVDYLINAIVPPLHLSFGRKQETLMKDGKVGIDYEIVTKRDDKIVPLKYESEGIKKIISISCALIALYNDQSILLGIDELDSGIFEYLLGELLDVLLEAKGQLIFTSHNLRPLEKLTYQDVVFTTSNKDDRYIKLKKTKELANLREIYIREVILGVKDYLYKETDNYLIKRALRKALK